MAQTTEAQLKDLVNHIKDTLELVNQRWKGDPSHVFIQVANKNTGDINTLSYDIKEQ